MLRYCARRVRLTQASHEVGGWLKRKSTGNAGVAGSSPAPAICKARQVIGLADLFVFSR